MSQDLTVTSSELEVDIEEFVLNEYSIILSLPDTAYSDPQIDALLHARGYKPGSYKIFSPTTHWQAYEQVYHLVVQNLRKKGALAVVINHDTGEILYRIGDLPTHTFMRLVQLRQPEGEGRQLTSWERLVGED